jgi:hypothetical protein
MAAIVGMSPHRAGAADSRGADAGASRSSKGGRAFGDRFDISVGAAGLFGAFSRVPGEYPLVRVGF